METNAIKVYEILKDQWGEKKATTVLDYLENSTSKKIDIEIRSKIEYLATKEDIQKIKSELIKWMFIFWIGTMGTIIAIMKLL